MVESYSKDRHLKRKYERRSDRTRFKKKLPTAACKTNGSAFIALISDISSSGAFIKTVRRFSVGQEIAMTITFPASRESRMVTGEIVRLSSNGVGISFKVFFKK
jgi:Tfp pilus assembly protein PilZ